MSETVAVNSSVSTTNNTNTVNQSNKGFNKLCKFFLKGNCKKDSCQFKHEYPDNKNYKKNRHASLKNKKNTECFEPMKRPVDLRILYDLNTDYINTELSDRDLLLVPNLFKNFQKYELFDKLVDEVSKFNSDLEHKDLLKLWHGNDKIEGTHWIADDKLKWKDNCPTFNAILDKLVDYFNVDIKATRFNWYSDTDQWKPFHHDAAAFDPKKSKSQNITIALSFGCTRYTALEFAEDNKNNQKTTISIPIADGEIYAFTNTTNKLWRHGILQEKNYKPEGRISIIIWGWVNNITQKI
jgi:hypothetical protein